MANLTRQQEYAARWLRRAGSCSLREAQIRGVSREALDAIVAAGLAERVEEPGRGPVYRIVERSPGRPPPSTAAVPAPIPHPKAPLQQRVLGLLADGIPRTGGEIADAVSASADFIARREAARETERTLGALRSARLVLRLNYAAGRNQSPLPQRYVLAETVAPVCLPCWRGKWSMAEQPPQIDGFPREVCVACGRTTNQAAWVSRAEVEAKR